VAEIQTGKSVNGKASANGLLTLPYLSVANVKDGYLALAQVKTMRVTQADVDRYSLRAGDVLFTEGGDADKLGRGCVWHGEISPCLHQNHVFAVRPVRELRAEYLAAYAASAAGKVYFLSAAKRTTNLASINSSQLREMPVPLPPCEEQDIIVNSMVVSEEYVARQKKVAQCLRDMKAVLSSDLLSGRIRILAPSLR
jgi:type I restriction enzyme S subunit